MELYPGLSSPGPIYAALPGTFDKAAKKSKYPTWGRHAADSLKSGRFRCEEVRFYSSRHMREKIGHYSPGPQYSVVVELDVVFVDVDLFRMSPDNFFQFFWHWVGL